MTFPTIPTVAAGRLLTAVQADTTATRTFPNLSGLTKGSGDLLIAICFAYQSSVTNTAFSGWTGGFTELPVGGDNSTTTGMAIGVAYKFSTGSETGTISVTQAATITGHAAFILLSIPAAHASTVPEAGGFASNTAAAADPAALDPGGWAAEETLWIAVAASGETGTGGNFDGVTAAPASYGNLATTSISQDAIGGTQGAVAFRQLYGASENVGAFSVDTSNARNSALVIAVRPSATSAITPAEAGAASDSLQVAAQVTLTDAGAGTDSFNAGELEPPEEVAGLAAWFDATKITGLSGGAAVSQWDDSSGNGRHATQATGGNQPTYQTAVQNGLPVVRFDGSDDYLRTTAFGPIEQPVTVFFSARLRSNPFAILWDTANSADRMLVSGNSTTQWEIYAQGSAVAGGTPDTTWHIFVARFNGASSSLKVDGTQVLSGSPGDGALLGVTLAADVDLGGDAPVDYGEWFAYGADVSAGDETTLTDYLTDKWVGTGGDEKTLADSGQAADSLQVAAEVPLAEAGSAADAVTVDAQAPLTDAGAAAEQPLTIAVTLADSGQAADALQVAAQIPLGEAGATTDALTVDQGVTPKTLEDSGAAADELTVAAAVTLTDSAAGFDQLAAGVPPAVPGLAGWWKAPRISGLNDGDAITSGAVQDLSGNSRHFTTVDGTVTYETGEINGKPVVRVSPGFLRTATFGPLTQPTTIFVVLRLLDTSGFYILLDSTTGASNRHVFAHNNATGDWELYAGGAAVAGGTPDTGSHVFTVTFNGASSSLRIDGAEVFSGDPGGGGLEGLTLGADVVGDGDSNALYGEVIVYDALVSETDRGLLETYLAQEWVPAGVAKTLTDSGQAADSLQVAAGAALADSGAAVDAITAGVAAATVEIGAIRWVQAEVGTPKTLADSGAGTEGLRVATAATLGDAAAAGDQLRVAATAALADSGQAVDSLTVGQFEPKSLTDSGAAADSLRVTAAVALTDAGAGSDLLVATAAVLLTQAAQASDSLTVNQGIPKTLGDSAAAADTVSATAQVPLPDSGAGADSVAVHQTRSLTDAAAAADSLTVGQFEPKTLADSGTGSEQLLPVAQAPLTEQGGGGDALTAAAQVTLGDSGQGTDSLSAAVLGETKTLADSGNAADVLAVTQSRALSDSGVGTDSLSVNFGRTLADSGTGSDGLRPAALLVLAEEATAADAVALAVIARLTETGQASETMVVLTVARWIRTTSAERPTTTSSREPATASSSREPALATSSQEQGGP